MLDIVELNGGVFFDSEETIKGFIHRLRRDNHDIQEMVLVPEKELLERLDQQGLEIVWLVDFFSSKNALNESIKSEEHPMKTRKYFVRLIDGKLEVTKVWDARFSNTRDNTE